MLDLFVFLLINLRKSSGLIEDLGHNSSIYVSRKRNLLMIIFTDINLPWLAEWRI
jgi:hypothetical protein